MSMPNSGYAASMRAAASASGPTGSAPLAVERGNEIVVPAGAEECAVTGHAKLIDAREDQRLSGKGHVAVTVVRPLAEPGGAIERLLERRGRARPMHPHRGERPRQRSQLHVLGEKELLQPGHRRLGLSSRHVEQKHPVRLEHVHVGEHPPLRREPGRVAARAFGESLNVVGQQPLQKRRAIGAGHRQLNRRGQLPDCCVFENFPVILLDAVHGSGLSRPPHHLAYPTHLTCLTGWL